jgi:PHD/YefM family antitoxin component YafN of YafNO toxin-antitoxin module
MSLTTFKLAGKEYVLIPRKRYDQLTRAEQDQRDAEIAAKGRASYLDGKMRTVSHGEAKRKLGL